MRSLVIILVVGFLLRIVSVGSIPPGISHDELDMVLNGYSLLATGRDITGDILPLTVGGQGLVMIPALLAGIGAHLFGLYPFGVRIIAVILGTAAVFLLYRISRKITGQNRAAIIAALLFAFSPWAIHFSRMIFDPPIAFFLMIFGIERFLYAERKSTYLLATVLLGLSLISYYGYIFIIPPLFIVLILYRLGEIREKRLVIINVVIFLSFMGMLFLMLTRGNTSLSGDRSSEIILTQSSVISEQVDFMRSQVPDQSLVEALFINKGTVLFTEIVGNYLSVFDPEMLFSFGESSEILSLRNWGFLYILDLPLILIGIGALFRYRNRQFFFMLALVLIAPLTVALSERTYAARASLLFPLLYVFAGYGAFFVLKRLSTTPKVLPRVTVGGFTLLYFMSVLGFLFQYHARFPVYASEIWFTNERSVSMYLRDHPEEASLVMTPEVKDTFYQYVFYADLDIEAVQTSMGIFQNYGILPYGNHIFMACSSEQIKGGVVIVDHTCGDISGADEFIYSQEGANTKLWGIYK